MFYQLIYTRCIKGIPININERSNEGYQVYSYTESIRNDKNINICSGIPSVLNESKKKVEWKNGQFSPDTYAYYVPSSSMPFMKYYHELRYNNAAQSHSNSGKWVNQSVIGDFSNVYPYELFGSKAVWDAGNKEPGYYDTQPPEYLPDKKKEVEYSHESPFYKFEKIGDFIKDGREEVLQNAVAFIAYQLSLQHDQKYLVILDNSQEKIELWIAAITCAFSSAIASKISFRTYIDFTKESAIQAIPIQSNNNDDQDTTKDVVISFIVGVNTNDTENATVARQNARNSFVLLNGEDKSISVDDQIIKHISDNHEYYSLITRFDKEHEQFCRSFCRGFGNENIRDSMINQWKCYTAIKNLTNCNQAQSILTLANDALVSLSTYREKDFQSVKEICDIVFKWWNLISKTNPSIVSVNDYLQHVIQLSSSFSVQEKEIIDMKTKDVQEYGFNREVLFFGSGSASSIQVWNNNSDKDKAARVLTDIENINWAFSNSRMTPVKACEYYSVYNNALNYLSSKISPDALNYQPYVLYNCIRVFCIAKDKRCYSEIVNSLSPSTPENCIAYLCKIIPYITKYISPQYQWFRDYISFMLTQFPKEKLKILANNLRNYEKNNSDAVKVILEYYCKTIDVEWCKKNKENAIDLLRELYPNWGKDILKWFFNDNSYNLSDKSIIVNDADIYVKITKSKPEALSFLSQIPNQSLDDILEIGKMLHETFTKNDRINYMYLACKEPIKPIGLLELLYKRGPKDYLILYAEKLEIEETGSICKIYKNSEKKKKVKRILKKCAKKSKICWYGVFTKIRNGEMDKSNSLGILLPYYIFHPFKKKRIENALNL